MELRLPNQVLQARQSILIAASYPRLAALNALSCHSDLPDVAIDLSSKRLRTIALPTRDPCCFSRYLGRTVANRPCLPSTTSLRSPTFLHAKRSSRVVLFQHRPPSLRHLHRQKSERPFPTIETTPHRAPSFDFAHRLCSHCLD